MPKPAALPSMLTVMDGDKQCTGHILSRGKRAFEAFDVDERSLGLFNDLKTAADAVSTASTPISGTP